MIKKKRFFLAIVFGLHYVDLRSKIGYASTMIKKKRFFLAIVFGLHYLCRLK